MLLLKKVSQGEDSEEDKEIDFTWVIFIGMNRLGFSKKEVHKMYFGEWQDFYEIYKYVYDFETEKKLYRMIEKPEEQEKLDSLLDL